MKIWYTSSLKLEYLPKKSQNIQSYLYYTSYIYMQFCRGVGIEERNQGFSGRSKRSNHQTTDFFIVICKISNRCFSLIFDRGPIFCAKCGYSNSNIRKCALIDINKISNTNSRSGMNFHGLKKTLMYAKRGCFMIL